MLSKKIKKMKKKLFTNRERESQNFSSFRESEGLQSDCATLAQTFVCANRVHRHIRLKIRIFGFFFALVERDHVDFAGFFDGSIAKQFVESSETRAG